MGNWYGARSTRTVVALCCRGTFGNGATMDLRAHSSKFSGTQPSISSSEASPDLTSSVVVSRRAVGVGISLRQSKQSLLSASAKNRTDPVVWRDGLVPTARTSGACCAIRCECEIESCCNSGELNCSFGRDSSAPLALSAVGSFVSETGALVF